MQNETWFDSEWQRWRTYDAQAVGRSVLSASFRHDGKIHWHGCYNILCTENNFQCDVVNPQANGRRLSYHESKFLYDIEAGPIHTTMPDARERAAIEASLSAEKQRGKEAEAAAVRAVEMLTPLTYDAAYKSYTSYTGNDPVESDRLYQIMMSYVTAGMESQMWLEHDGKKSKHEWHFPNAQRWWVAGITTIYGIFMTLALLHII